MAKQRTRKTTRPKRPKLAPRYGFATIRKDPLDLRDLMYEGSLAALPRTLNNRRRVPEILDQEEEGACTGFGLAAVVNYLIANHPQAKAWKGGVERKQGWLVSPRMLYEMAKRYDEWPGESYEGSSIRGAMKGWHRHGVCLDRLWAYKPRKPGRATPQILMDAHQRPLGNYFRVRHLHLSHMHAALREAGILLASARVHDGWERVDRKGRIPFSQDVLGGHAFAIVGYDGAGFWIQNSWGKSWGLNGFAHLSYDDWLENAWDCWVARLGVPTVADGTAGRAVAGRASTFDYIPDEAVVLTDIRPHFINLGNDGVFSRTGRYATTVEDLDEIFTNRLPTTIRTWRRPRLLLYAHGGLNSEAASGQRIASMRPYLLANEIYPLHFMWETGLLETVRHIVQDTFRSRRFKGWRDELTERFRDLLDEGIELAARPLGRPLWREMKENARKASGPDGGAAYVAASLAGYVRQHGIDVHLAGHSAGSILLAHLVTALTAVGVSARSLTLFAPACTTGVFQEHVLPRLGTGVERLAIFNLSDRLERDDRVGPYGKSLLYLVHEAFEERKGEAILGMERCHDAEPAVAAALGDATLSSGCVIYRHGLPGNVTLAASSTSHGGFDNDPDTLNSLLRIVTGRKAPAHPFPHTSAAIFEAPREAR